MGILFRVGKCRSVFPCLLSLGSLQFACDKTKGISLLLSLFNRIIHDGTFVYS